MKKKLLVYTLAMVVVCAVTSCVTNEATVLSIMQGNYNQVNRVVITNEPLQKFHDLTKGIEVKVLPTSTSEEISKNGNYSYIFHYSGKSFFESPTVQYVHSMGLIEMSPSTDYRLNIKINQADFNDYRTEVNLKVTLCDSHGKEVFSQNDISSVIAKVSTCRIHDGHVSRLDKAYTQALEQINWNRIASFLRTEQLPKDEPQKQVQGLGEMALEQTIIRWDVQSRPQGADLFWRVVSKTPDVKTSSTKYLQTTPYEATKALDIKGLTYENSSSVRIILRCEKDGYLPQEKEYDVRMIMDQEEISAFFRLVKEE